MRKDFWYVVVLHFLIMYLLTLLVEDLVCPPCSAACLQTLGRTEDFKLMHLLMLSPMVGGELPTGN